MGFDGWASGGVGDAEGLPTLALVEVVFGSGLRLGWIEPSGLIEVIWGGPQGDLFGFGATEIEFSWGRPPGGVEERWRGRLTDVGEDLRDRHGVGEKRDEREGGTAGGANQGEDLVNPGQKSRPAGGAGGACD